jgi:hypothetical protein
MTTIPDPTPERITRLARTVHAGVHCWGKTPMFFAVLNPKQDDEYQLCFTHLEEHPHRPFPDIATEFMVSMPGLQARVFGFGCVYDHDDPLLGTLDVALIADRHGNLWRTTRLKRFATAEPIEHYHPAGTETSGGPLADEIRAAGMVVAQFRSHSTHSDNPNRPESDAAK